MPHCDPPNQASRVEAGMKNAAGFRQEARGEREGSGFIQEPGSGMKTPAGLAAKTMAALAAMLLAMAAMLFLPAWSLRYWEAWIFWFEFAGLTVGITIYLLIKDPALVERRLAGGPTAEKEKSQQVIQSLALFFFCALIVLPAIDHRLGWSHLSWPFVLLGHVLVAIGWFVIFLTFRENSFASSIIEVDPEQRVVSTGPYRLVRHPMYAGALVFMLGVPLALGSWWGLLPWVALAAIILWRLLEEEAYLSRNLPGYTDYCARTRYRLIPRIY